MRDKSDRTAKTIRMSEDVYQQAKVAAVISRKTVGVWIEEALLEKLHREAVEFPAKLRARLGSQPSRHHPPPGLTA